MGAQWPPAHPESAMTRKPVHLAVLVAVTLSGAAIAHDTDSQIGPLGKVSFPTTHGRIALTAPAAP